MQFRVIIWAGYVSVMEEARNLYNVFVEEPQEGHLTDMKIDVKIISLSM
jgi:hypothetical protein